MSDITREFSTVDEFLTVLPTLRAASPYNADRESRSNPRDWLGIEGSGKASPEEVAQYLQSYRAETGALDVSGIDKGEAKTRKKTMQFSGNFCAVSPTEYIDGRAFLGVRKRQRTGRIIDLKIAINYNFNVSAERVIKAAQVLIDFIDAAETEGHQVALTAGYFARLTTSGEQLHRTTIKIKSAGEYMDASNLFICAHPAFFRSLILGMRALDAPSKIDNGISCTEDDPAFFDLLKLTPEKLLELAA